LNKDQEIEIFHIWASHFEDSATKTIEKVEQYPHKIKGVTFPGDTHRVYWDESKGTEAIVVQTISHVYFY